MKKCMIISLIVLLTAVSFVSGVEEKVIEAGTKITGDVKLANVNLRIMDGAEVRGNIFIEEGDLFILKEVKITGTTTLKNGNLNIGNTSQLAGNIFIEEGDLFIADEVNIVGSLTIKKAIFLSRIPSKSHRPPHWKTATSSWETKD